MIPMVYNNHCEIIVDRNEFPDRALSFPGRRESVRIPMAEVIRAVEEVFVEKGNGRVEMPPKPGIHPLPDAFIHAMRLIYPRWARRHEMGERFSPEHVEETSLHQRSADLE